MENEIMSGPWWAHHHEELQEQAVIGIVWCADIHGSPVLHFTGMEGDGMENQVVGVQAKLICRIPPLEVCQWLHDAGITTVEQLEELKRGK